MGSLKFKILILSPSSSFNTSKLTEAQFYELNQSLKNLPASQLSRKMANPSLNSLRRKLFDLNLHEDLLHVLGKKYFPDKFYQKQETTIETFLGKQDLPEAISSVVRKALQSAKTPLTTKIYKHTPTSTHSVASTGGGLTTTQ